MEIKDVEIMKEAHESDQKHKNGRTQRDKRRVYSLYGACHTLLRSKAEC